MVVRDYTTASSREVVKILPFYHCERFVRISWQSMILHKVDSTMAKYKIRDLR
ncbi:hypothetical protein [Helicobacter sp. MIT 05-5294]|uniref:hypothetical protein n=1 Tax=Helicobacter sp. MIT 05-5294 TaxID=1548150 RepID=UPI001883C94F|nr:hypothetical protein [Helicobacter sp. MIT 05-5294]